MKVTRGLGRASGGMEREPSRGVLLGLLLFVFLTALSGVATGEVPGPKVERKTKLISNGPGQRPFDVTRHSIPLGEIERSVPKDAIPALARPEFLTAQKAGIQLKDSDRVLGVFLNDEAKAYPVVILNWHEVVNDVVGNKPVLVTWCPLCGSSLVFDPVVEGRRLTFGVSGLLYKRNALFYDHETMSLWSQLLSQAVTGPMAGSPLRVLPATNATWGEWKKAHPETSVLSFHTGYQREYTVDPYVSYPLARHPALWVSAGGSVRIYPFSELKKVGSPLADQVGGQDVTIVYDDTSRQAEVEAPGGNVSYFVAFLDNLKAFYPRAEVYKASKHPGDRRQK
jgi:hypothetical protein